MRLAILSDIHGNLMALEAVLADARQQGTDKLWILGDLCAMGPRPKECLDLIRTLKAEVISGNTDRYLVTGRRPEHRVTNTEDFATLAQTLSQRDSGFNWTLAQLSYKDYEYLTGLRGELDMQVPDYGWIIAYHGAPGNDERNLLPDTPTDEVLDQLLDREGRLAMGGHTHRAMDRDLGIWRVINVGSVGLPMDSLQPTYALLTFEQGQVTVDIRRITYDFEAAVADVHAQLSPDFAAFIMKVMNRAKE